jgi:thymidylate kinase
MEKIIYWAFEGNEGTGKTTLSKKFAEECNALWTYEPNAETSELKYLRKLALEENKKISNYARENILLANRIIHQDNCIKPLIAGKTTVVTDRCFLSGLVYAKLKSFEFQKFMEISVDSNIRLYPDVIIYCTNKDRKIVKNKNDIYDNADLSTLEKIDLYYEQAISFINTNIHTKNIKVIKFENDFNIDVSENLKNLINILKKELAT